ncbi:hypothetical protein RLEG12_24005 [Rhizobium leguminosarum bv. trifolii CB782]|nr:hypothetical protein RLEG12_24005 [Rhizobium leguminosarum bv. trifolii CB782]
MVTEPIMAESLDMSVEKSTVRRVEFARPEPGRYFCSPGNDSDK